MPRAPLRRHPHPQNRDMPVTRNQSYKKIPSSSPAKADLAKKLANKPVGPRPTDSDDSDRLVVRGNGRRGRFTPTQEIFASGAVGAGDKPGNHPTRAQSRKSLTDATREILLNGVKDTQTEKASARVNGDRVRSQPKESLSHVNGITKKSKVVANETATITSSAVKPSGSLLRPLQPTPTRENSILGTLKPRRRQASILQNLDQDSSSFDIEDENQFLPHNESTPLDQSKAQTPATSHSHTSPLLSSRKRKFGVSNPLDPGEGQNAQNNPISPLEPSLPAVELSALRESGKKHRESRGIDDDVMALPQSSSSPAPSPVRTKNPTSAAKSKTRASKPAPTMTTKELLEAAMPLKRRRTTRQKLCKPDAFDIPSDDDIEDANENDDSSFSPAKKDQRKRRKEPMVKPSNGPRVKAPAKSKAGRGAGHKSKSSTNHFTTISTSAPLLMPSTTSNREN